MKKTIIITLLCLCPTWLMAQKSLTVLHTSDTHSCILPLSENLADTLVAGRGGFLRRVEMLKEMRQKDHDLLLFDSGDFSQGSSYYTLFKGDVEIGLMNLMRYDAVTIGNHEFDFGLENMARIFREAKFPIVCSNYDFTGTPVEGLVKPYIILRRKGLKIGVFGLAPKMLGLVDENKCRGVKYLDPTSKALEMAALLKEKEKCDVIICLSHLGWNMPEDGDNDVFKGTRYVDLVLGGHSHTYLKNLVYVKDLDGRSVPIDHNGKHAIYVGDLKLDLKEKK